MVSPVSYRLNDAGAILFLLLRRRLGVELFVLRFASGRLPSRISPGHFRCEPSHPNTIKFPHPAYRLKQQFSPSMSNPSPGL